MNVRIAIITLFSLCVGNLATAADAPKPTTSKPAATKAPAVKPSNGKPANGQPADAEPASDAVSPEEAARQAIFRSKEWRETQHAFFEWLSVQKIYTPEEVKKIRSDLKARTAHMTADQLRNFLSDAEEKLKVLMSPQAEEARLWLAQRMAVEVHLTPEQIKEERPDIVNMTAAQVEQRLAKLQLERQQIRQAQKAFDQGRQQQVKDMQRQQREQEREREDALNRAYYDVATPYAGYFGGGVSTNNQLRYGPSAFDRSSIGLSFGTGGSSFVTYGYRF